MHITRRTALKHLALASTAAVAAPGFALTSRGQASPPPHGSPEPFALPPLPYAYDALEPSIDTLTMEIHHGKHHAGYVRKLNAALAQAPEFASRPLEVLLKQLDRLPESIRTAVRNNGGGHYNHTLFWNCLSPDPAPPQGRFDLALTDQFGGIDLLREQLATGGASVFGSGWVWLTAAPDGTLAIETTPNQDNPLMTGNTTPLLGIDVWEHAYYLHYQNRRADYLQAVLGIVDWTAAAERYDAVIGG